MPVSASAAAPRKPASHRPGDPRREGRDQRDADEHDDRRGRRILQRQRAETDDEEILGEAEDPVRERLRAGVGEERACRSC